MEPLKNPMQRLWIFGDLYEDLFTDLQFVQEAAENF